MAAVDRPRNVVRWCASARSADLFRATIVQLEWRRIGTREQGRAVLLADQTEAERFERQLLRRRAGAKAPIGVARREVLRPSPDVP